MKIYIVEEEKYKKVCQDSHPGDQVITTEEYWDGYKCGNAVEDGTKIVYWDEVPGEGGNVLHRSSKLPVWVEDDGHLEYFSVKTLMYSDCRIPVPSLQDKTGTGYTSEQRAEWAETAKRLFLETDDVIERDRIVEVVKREGFVETASWMEEERRRIEEATRRDTLASLSNDLTTAYTNGDNLRAEGLLRTINSYKSNGADVLRWADVASRPIDIERVKEYFSRGDRSIESDWDIYSNQLNQTDTRVDRNKVIFPRGELSVIGAKRSHGKTTALLSIASHIAKSTGKHVFYVTFEEVEEVIVSKLLRSWNGWTVQEFESKLMADDVSSMVANCQQLHVLSWKGRTIESLRDMFKAMDMSQCGAVVVDYIQRATTDNRSERRLEVGMVCEVLEQIAQIFDVPVIAGSQMNRDTKSPHPSTFNSDNLGESAKIEEIASFVVCFWALKNEMVWTDKTKNGISECWWPTSYHTKTIRETTTENPSRT